MCDNDIWKRERRKGEDNADELPEKLDQVASTVYARLFLLRRKTVPTNRTRTCQKPSDGRWKHVYELFNVNVSNVKRTPDQP